MADNFSGISAQRQMSKTTPPALFNEQEMRPLARLYQSHQHKGFSVDEIPYEGFKLITPLLRPQAQQRCDQQRAIVSQHPQGNRNNVNDT